MDGRAELVASKKAAALSEDAEKEAEKRKVTCAKFALGLKVKGISSFGLKLSTSSLKHLERRVAVLTIVNKRKTVNLVLTPALLVGIG